MKQRSVQTARPGHETDRGTGGQRDGRQGDRVTGQRFSFMPCGRAAWEEEVKPDQQVRPL